MEKPEVCYIRLYPDNLEDALIIEGLGTRKRKGEKSKLIKDMLYAYFGGKPATTAPLHVVTEPLLQIMAEIPGLSEGDKEILRKNLDELSDMFM